MYFVLDSRYDETIIGSVRETNPSFGLKYTKGIVIPPDEAPECLIISIEQSPSSYPDFFQLQATPIVSEKFVATLKNNGINNFVAYPTKIVEQEKEVTGYYVINIIGLISCLDEDNSEVTKWKGRIARMKKLILDDTKIKAEDIFRVKEYPLVIVISEKTKDILKDLSGIFITPADGWSDSSRF